MGPFEFQVLVIASIGGAGGFCVEARIDSVVRRTQIEVAARLVFELRIKMCEKLIATCKDV